VSDGGSVSVAVKFKAPASAEKLHVKDKEVKAKARRQIPLIASGGNLVTP
jgi:hypothetical protein